MGIPLRHEWIEWGLGTQNTCNKDGTSQKWRFSNLFFPLYKKTSPFRVRSHDSMMKKWLRKYLAPWIWRELKMSHAIFADSFVNYDAAKTAVISLLKLSSPSDDPTADVNCGKFIVSQVIMWNYFRCSNLLLIPKYERWINKRWHRQWCGHEETPAFFRSHKIRKEKEKINWIFFFGSEEIVWRSKNDGHGAKHHRKWMEV